MGLGPLSTSPSGLEPATVPARVAFRVWFPAAPARNHQCRPRLLAQGRRDRRVLARARRNGLQLAAALADETSGSLSSGPPPMPPADAPIVGEINEETAANMADEDENEEFFNRRVI
ncbi:hypothetical protein FALBO_9168 [Fusarium albosuccineum]|uniref:Uncharacterized protein n=1 Tax=Fusarium albosuccineum TaxID=1237068 RepID=A0A8H4L9H8_9HYPO|nr:hypothetical protein FALBO_9168 [Fusarium albosuccineum]